MEKFSEACVIASTHTVVLVQSAFEAGYLPRRNPFVIYFLFAAALILMSNEFALLYINSAADQCIRNAITIMTYSAETDPQASRLLYILSTFRDVIIQQRDQRARQQQTANQLPPFNMKANINPYGSQSFAQSENRTPGGVTLPSVGATSSTLSNLPPISLARNENTTAPSSLNGITLPNPTSFPTTPLAFTSRPLEPSLASPMPPNPLSPRGGPSGLQTPTLGSLERQLSFSNVFDLTGLDGISISGDSQDEHFDFDALWALAPNSESQSVVGIQQGVR